MMIAQSRIHSIARLSPSLFLFTLCLFGFNNSIFSEVKANTNTQTQVQSQVQKNSQTNTQSQSNKQEQHQGDITNTNNNNINIKNNPAPPIPIHVEATAMPIVVGIAPVKVVELPKTGGPLMGLGFLGLGLLGLKFRKYSEQFENGFGIWRKKILKKKLQALEN